MNAARKRAPSTPLGRFRQALWRWTWRSIALVLIGTAVLLTIARLMLPFAGEYRAELERRVESYLGHEVEIGELDIDWHRLGPRVQISDLRVFRVGPERQALEFERAYLSLLPVMRDGMPTLRLDDFSLIGFTLRARLDEQGVIHAFGARLDPAALGLVASTDVGAADSDTADADAADGGEPAAGAGTPAAMADALERVFSISRLQLREATLLLTRPDGEVVRWENLGLTLLNAGDEHNLSLSVTPPATVGERLAGRLQFTGPPAEYRSWRASLYLDLRQLSLARLSSLWPQAPVRADGGRLDARLWSDWRSGRLQEARAELAGDGLALNATAADGQVRFERVAGRARLWQPSADQWQLDVGGLEVRRGGRDWPDGRLSYALEDDGAWRLAAQFLRVEDVAAVAGLLPLDPSMQESLREHAPAGDVHGLKFAMTAAGEFRLRSDFRDLGWSARGNIPGLTGLDGRVGLRSSGGRMALESTDVGFDAPQLFRQPLQMQELSAALRVIPTAEGYRLDAPRIHLRNKDLRGRGRARVELARGEPPWLDLQFDYRDGVATAVPRYLPAGIMPAPVVGWLDQAFRAGRVPQGSFLLRGRADDFPFRAHEGVFDVHFEVADTTLHYGDGWPSIEGLGGRVRFTGPSLDIRADRGTTGTVSLRQGHARFDDLKSGQLQVDVEAGGPLGGMLDVVRESPLQERFAAVLDGARAEGDAELSLGLSVPVAEVEATRVNGSVRMAGTRVTQSRYDLAFTQVDGNVRFSERSVAIDDLRAQLRGRPLRLDAATRKGIARFRARGAFAPVELLPALADGPLAAATGRADWEVELAVPLTVPGAPELVASSDLQGTRVRLPAPIGKAADEARAIRVAMPFEGRTLRGGYGPDLRFVIALADTGALVVRKAGLAFAEAPRLPAADGLRVSGVLTRVSLVPWLAFAFADGAGDGGGEAALPLVELDLRARAVDLQGYRLSGAAFRGQQRDDGSWRLEITSNEATGTLDWPLRNGGGPPVSLRFDWIDVALMRPPVDAGADPGPQAPSFDDPAALPPLDVRIERLKLTDATLRSVTLLTGRRRGSLVVHQVGFETEHLRVSGQGEWGAGAAGGTDLRLVVQSEAFGPGLHEMGYGGMLSGGDGKVILDLAWPGPPWQPSLAGLSGDIDIRIDDGVLTEVKPGAARLLGLFSLKAMPFRTLVQSGLIFSEMKGRVDLADGNAYTKLLKIKSTVGVIRISGRTGLLARDYDQRIVITPDVGSSLPVLGFLSGGPIAGAVIALIQGVARNVDADLEDSTLIEYTVTGSWDDPRIERVAGPEPGEQGVPELPR